MQNNLKNIIKSKGLKNTFICEKLNLHPSILSGYIKSTRKPNQDRLKQLCKVLGVKVVDIYPHAKSKRITYYYI